MSSGADLYMQTNSVSKRQDGRNLTCYHQCTGGERESMEWVGYLRKTVELVESHLTQDITAEEIARQIGMSSLYLQKGFKLLTGYSLGEYMRNRRLYMAALDVIRTDDKVIDIALRYCYETPESFTKAFTRFHGATPVNMRSHPWLVKTFLPLSIEVAVRGGCMMNYIVEKMDAFSLIGFERSFSFECPYEEIPPFWDEVRQTHIEPLFAKSRPESALERAIVECGIGEFGLSFNCAGGAQFGYLISGRYDGRQVPEGLTVVNVPAFEWAKFTCTGPMPGALQSLNTQIYSNWLPGNTEYEIAADFTVEWYSRGDMSSPDYQSAIWVPVRRKK